MPWERHDPKRGSQGFPVGVASIGKSRQGILFGVQSTRKWKLLDLKRCTVSRDMENRLVAFQFGSEGPYSVGRHQDSRMILCADLIRSMGIKPGRYSAKLDREGFVIVDFKVKR